MIDLDKAIALRDRHHGSASQYEAELRDFITSAVVEIDSMRDHIEDMQGQAVKVLGWETGQKQMELEKLRKMQALLRSLLCEEGMKNNFLCYNVGAELVVLLYD